MMRCFRHMLRDRRGVASVEMALMTPVVFALMFTTFEGGNYLWTEHKVIKGVRQGARYAARLPFARYSCGDTTPTDTTAANEISLTRIRNVVRYGNPNADGFPKVKGWDDDQENPIIISVSCSTETAATDNGLYQNFDGGVPLVRVSTVVTYPALLGLLGFDTTNVKVRAEAQAAVSGV